MICKTINKQIPKLIRRELDTYERISIINHLKNCNDCRNKYLNQLKIFYLIDKGLVNENLDFNKNHFVSELRNKLKTSRNQKFHKYFKSYLYAAAAILIIIIFSFFFFTNIQPVVNQKIENSGIENALKNEDWITLQEILKNDREIKKFAYEQIPIELLIEKLTGLEKQGIKVIDYIELFNRTGDSQNFYAFLNENNQIGQIQVNTLVQTLEKFKSSKNKISLYEIGLFLAENNKGGIES